MSKHSNVIDIFGGRAVNRRFLDQVVDIHAACRIDGRLFLTVEFQAAPPKNWLLRLKCSLEVEDGVWSMSQPILQVNGGEKRDSSRCAGKFLTISARCHSPGPTKLERLRAKTRVKLICPDGSSRTFSILYDNA